MTLRIPRLLAVSAGFLLMILGLAGPAFADSASISVTDTGGKFDPVTGVPRTYTVSGTTSSPKNIYVKVRNPGPTPCAPTADSDSGEYWDGYDGFYGRGGDANGNFKFSDVFATDLEGSYLFCIWVADSDDTSVTAIAQTITFRAPSGTISATISPTNPQPGQQATATINGVSEAPERVYGLARPAGTPCAQTYDADYRALTGDNYSAGDGTDVNGNFNVPMEVTQSTAGNYVLCLWLADSSDDASPVAGPQPIPFTVGHASAGSGTVTKECKTARSRRHRWAKRVKATKRSLLRARHRSTRRKLTRRLKKQRRSLRIATHKMKVICGT